MLDARFLPVALIFTAMSLSACHTEETRVVGIRSGDRPVYCTVLADPVRRAGSDIVAPAHFRCDRPGAESLALTVSLERLGADGVWAVVAGERFTVGGVDTTRDLGERRRVRQVGIPCAGGTYRTTVRAVSTSRRLDRVHTMTTRPTREPCTRLSL